MKTALIGSSREVIQEIKQGYTHSYRDFSRRLQSHSMISYGPQSILAHSAKKTSFFSKLPSNLGSLIKSYVPSTQMRYSFLVNSGLVKSLTPGPIESPEVAAPVGLAPISPSNSQAPAPLLESLDPDDVVTTPTQQHSSLTST